MKTSRLALAGGALVVLAAVLFLRAGNPSAEEQAAGGASGKRESAGLSASAADSSSLSRRERSEAPPRSAPAPGIDPGFASRLDSLWKRPDEEALLDALDEVGAFPDPGQWRAVSGVLERHAATEARSNVIDYLLATGDAAPDDVRLSIYASALDNRAAGVADSARLELQNITGRVFRTSAEARAWIRSNPPAPEEEIPAQ